MPEGDTVFRLARRLGATLDGSIVTRTQFRVPQHATASLDGATVLEHDTHGKHLLTRFSSGFTLHTHLKMSGSWTVTRGGRRLPGRVMPDVRVLFATDRGDTAHGLLLPVVDLVPTAAEATLIGHLGPDPLRADWDATEAAVRVAASPGRAVNAVLLDQTCIAGLGNLWTNELCFLRGLNPWRSVGDCNVAGLVALAARALRVSAHEPGHYQVTTGDTRRGRQHYVAGRAGRPCLRCGTIIRAVGERQGPGGRRTWWCPRCQP
jgi:endonuclease-8